MALTVFGINHKCTDLEKLEQITFTPEDVTASLALLSREKAIDECVILSTCNRIEVYAVCQEGFPLRHYLHDFIKHAKPAGMDDILEKFYSKEENAAIEHLFSVISGLDSLVIGENEIAGQVKAAYRKACECKMNGMLTNKLFHAAFRMSKRVKNETTINEGNCSVGCVAVDLAEDIFQDLQQCRALVIGAGEIGSVVVKTLANRQVEHIIIANRSFPRAVQLAEEVGGTAIPLDEISAHIGKVDIIVSGTGSPEYLLRYEDMQALLKHHPQQRLLIVDIALPRDFDPQIGTLPKVILKNLYDLKAIVDRNLKKRAQEIPNVQKILAEEVQKFLNWQESLKIMSTIKALQNHFETIRLQELETYHYQFSEEAFSQVDTFTKSLTKKYIHLIISNLKSLHEVCELDPRQLHIIQHLFDSDGIINNERTHCRFKRQQSGVATDPNSDRPCQGDLPVTEC